MRSVRLEAELEAELEAAARATGKPVSQIIREAVERRCRELKADRLDVRLADVIGTVSGEGRGSRDRQISQDSGRDFADQLEQKDRKRRRRGRS